VDIILIFAITETTSTTGVVYITGINPCGKVRTIIRPDCTSNAFIFLIVTGITITGRLCVFTLWFTPPVTADLTKSCARYAASFNTLLALNADIIAGAGQGVARFAQSRVTAGASTTADHVRVAAAYLALAPYTPFTIVRVAAGAVTALLFPITACTVAAVLGIRVAC
jgi:hypothetical protein